MIDLNGYIDHTILKPTATNEQIVNLCNEAHQNHFASVCVPPHYVEKAVKTLSKLKSEVKVATVVGFPFGYDFISAKLETIKRAIDLGASEIDAVININAVKNKNWDYIEDEIDSLTTVTKLKYNKTLKLIFETAYLNEEEIQRLCNLCIKHNVDFAKTSTGYAPEGAKIETVKLMKSVLGDKVKIKASGGIKDRTFAEQLIEAGASRLGTSSGIQLIK